MENLSDGCSWWGDDCKETMVFSHSYSYSDENIFFFDWCGFTGKHIG